MTFPYECIECRQCEENCSIFIATGKYSPVEKIRIIQDLYKGLSINEEQIHTIFNCTKCEACQHKCPQGIPLIELYDWARHKIQTSYGLCNDKQFHLIHNIVHTGNPFGHEDSRLEGVPREVLENRMEYEFKPVKSKTLLHLGCMLSYRLHSMRDDVLKIFNLLNIDYTLLRNENCCGYFVWNTGDHDTAKEIIQKNTQVFEDYEKIICACAGCYTFFKEHYPHPEKFYHSIEIIDTALMNLQEEGRLNSQLLNVLTNKSVVFHDSCHLTRPHKIITPPRRVLSTLGIDAEEFSHSGADNLCCGADGGLRIINPELAVKIGIDRVKEAREIGAGEIITLCPFCIFNFRDASSDNESVEVESLYHYIRTFLELNLKEK